MFLHFPATWGSPGWTDGGTNRAASPALANSEQQQTYMIQRKTCQPRLNGTSQGFLNNVWKINWTFLGSLSLADKITSPCGKLANCVGVRAQGKRREISWRRVLCFFPGSEHQTRAVTQECEGQSWPFPASEARALREGFQSGAYLLLLHRRQVRCDCRLFVC